MPYKGNETLVFSSNIGGTDTIFFLEKDTLIAYPEAQALNGRTYEVVTIFCRHSDSSIPGSSNRYDFVELQKSKDKKARLHFSLRSKKASFFRITGIKVDSLAQQPTTSLVIKSKKYDDVYVINSDDDWINPNLKSTYVSRFYWSKSEGLIRYDMQDGEFWELTNKYSP